MWMGELEVRPPVMSKIATSKPSVGNIICHQTR
jgi:hypothetical protein